MIRRVVVAIGLIVVALVILLGLVSLGQRSLIYFPTRSAPVLVRSGLAGAEPVTFSSDDGVRLNAWFVAAPAPGSRPTVLIFNGNAGHREYRAPLAAALRSHGLHVLLTDYRGYGDNPGSPTEEGLAADARAARTFLLHRPDVDPKRIVYFGESLGAAVAVRLAVAHPPAALILRSPFSSLAEVGRYHYPLLPVQLLLRDRFPSIDLAPRILSPVLVVAGTRDRVVPIEHSRRLYNAVVAPKTFLEVAADHNDDALLDGEEMIQAIVRFVSTGGVK